jgi:hypothetical protein
VIEAILSGIFGGLVGAFIFRVVLGLTVRPRRGEVRMASLCYTGRTVYGIDRQGRVWFINLETAKWELHGNPTEAERVKA